MSTSNRDLLVMFNQELLSPKAIEHEVEMLHEMLYAVESLDNIAISHEVIDLNKYKIVSNPSQLRKFLRQREFKPFIFLNNKN